MPCQKCSNGKWKYGEHGRWQFDTLAACKRAAAAIHIQDKQFETATKAELCCDLCAGKCKPTGDGTGLENR